MFDEAIQQARILDEEFLSSGKLKGPLHGVPVTFKDQYAIKGKDSCIGFSAWCNSPRTEDAYLVKVVREAGGIILNKTNVPQTMLNFEGSNPVWGVTNNPWNTAYSPGGSSSGEAVGLATDASALGVGSDVGQ